MVRQCEAIYFTQAKSSFLRHYDKFKRGNHNNKWQQIPLPLHYATRNSSKEELMKVHTGELLFIEHKACAFIPLRRLMKLIPSWGNEWVEIEKCISFTRSTCEMPQHILHNIENDVVHKEKGGKGGNVSYAEKCT